MATVKDIVDRYLRENGYDGLCNKDGECGCGLGDLMPCQCVDGRACEAAYSVSCNGCDAFSSCYCDSKDAVCSYRDEWKEVGE